MKRLDLACIPRVFALLPAVAGTLIAASAAAGVCTDTADLMSRACDYDGRDDRLTERAKCLNLKDPQRSANCNAKASDDFAEHAATCAAQLQARLAACAAIGDGPYDPDYDPALFDSDFSNLSNPNPYYPLTPGNRWVYRSADERSTVVVLDHTKRIRGLTCIVVVDKVFSGGLKEKTNDWYCQAKNGDVHYAGEETGEYVINRNDSPAIPELVSIDGSFKNGRDRNKGGIIMLANPQVGTTYYEEMALGEAEDIAEVVSTSYGYGNDTMLDTLVPQDLAMALCANNDCIVTRNTSQLEPDVEEFKYYAAGIGTFLETDPSTGEVVRLVKCNFDSRCDSLPQP